MGHSARLVLHDSERQKLTTSAESATLRPRHRGRYRGRHRRRNNNKLPLARSCNVSPVKKVLTNEIVVHANICAKVGNALPGEGNSRTFAAPSGADLAPSAPAAFTLSGTLLDPGAADFTASVGWLPPGMVAFAVPHTINLENVWDQ